MRAKFITVKYYSDGSGEPEVELHDDESAMLDHVCDTVAGNRTVVIKVVATGHDLDAEPLMRIIYSDLRTEE